MCLALSSSQTRSKIKEWIAEADELLSKGDVVQACEKYYKAAEEAVKMLAVKLNMTDLLNKVKEQKRWSSDILFSVAFRAPKEIHEAWKSAWVLHVYGFHEMSLEMEQVNLRANKVRLLANIF
ncbi:hypothetical protein B9Q01_01910 [Candidatus Marsarchaeota G1 archaeon OSP_D]|jgi:hypothetical protein|uniref:HEPN domain-containing protein n=3 Tax=Candidatus Marsarchaeota group 1 TaxID=2203770 RepID=A0A2R6AJG2_9ARCH|nr:MAG: hypothetical protein B9Q01_01910 [Candidatus Marsarchaeota G1 archaeon OSP_D]PSN86522.1 MAG: hypothetical protein B9Q02_02090 [Candidatus Marsarchaeota G1 archaeon BE_D]PSN89216.1 MAG: hypothetical protein B9Q00_02375 [Candidatus Marsarchaeota G1 archaeon OSP_C]